MQGFMEELISIFLDEAKKILVVIDQAMMLGDSEALFFYAHSVKGSSNLEARKLAAACRALEAFGKVGTMEGVGEVVNTVRIN